MDKLMRNILRIIYHQLMRILYCF